MHSLERHQTSNGLSKAVSGDFHPKGKCCSLVNSLFMQDIFTFILWIT